jgi:hypothetical protein
MNRFTKMAVAAAALALMPAMSGTARAQDFGGMEQMQQFAPMLDMMKQRMGKKRFAQLMQTMGPMMEKMMSGQGGGFGGMGGGFGGMGGGFNSINSFGGPGGFSGGDMSGMMGMLGSGENLSSMIGLISSFSGKGGLGGKRTGKKIRRAKVG